MAFMAMSFLGPTFSIAQSNKPYSPRIKTPDTSTELRTKEDVKDSEGDNQRDFTRNSPSPRKVQKHGAGIGLGQTFLLGNYSNHGNDKITLDLFYSYTASYSFDLLINGHVSEHKDENEKMRVMGLSSSIKARVVEYDNLSPYFLGGLGFYAPRAKRNIDNQTKWSDQRMTFGLNFGGGLDLRLNDHYVVGVMGQLHWPFEVQQNHQSDLKGYYFKMLLTGMYLF